MFDLSSANVQFGREKKEKHPFGSERARERERERERERLISIIPIL